MHARTNTRRHRHRRTGAARVEVRVQREYARRVHDGGGVAACRKLRLCTQTHARTDRRARFLTHKQDACLHAHTHTHAHTHAHAHTLTYARCHTHARAHYQARTSLPCVQVRRRSPHPDSLAASIRFGFAGGGGGGMGGGVEDVDEVVGRHGGVGGVDGQRREQLPGTDNCCNVRCCKRGVTSQAARVRVHAHTYTRTHAGTHATTHA
jgi:hypothetical protein